MVGNPNHLSTKDFIKAMKAIENVGHGVYSMVISNNCISITSQNNNESFLTRYDVQTIGEAVVDFTGPLYKSLENSEFVSINFNDDSVLVICTPNVTIARAPYVVV